MQPPPRSTSIRVANQLGARPRGRSSRSVIIHDINEEEEVVETIEQPEEQKCLPPVASTSRTRKARDTQYKLGVGRPTIAGGSGARVVTKSVSVSRGSKRVKSTRNVKPSAETIVEGELYLSLGHPLVISSFSELEPEPEPEQEPELEQIPGAVQCQSINEFRLWNLSFSHSIRTGRT